MVQCRGGREIADGGGEGEETGKGKGYAVRVCENEFLSLFTGSSSDDVVAKLTTN